VTEEKELKEEDDSQRICHCAVCRRDDHREPTREARPEL